LKRTENFAALRDEVIGLAIEEPDESTEFEGVVDFHWGFDWTKPRVSPKL